jgi:hypothetical protein
MVSLAGAAMLPASASAQQAPCTKTWSGAAAASWGTAANWTPAGVPATTDVVCAGVGSDITLNVAASVRAIRTLGTLDGNAALTLNDADQPSWIGVYEQTTTLGGPGDVEIGTLISAQGGSMTGTGTTTVTGHSTISANGSIGTGRTLITRGTGTWSGSRTATGTARWVNSAAVTVSSGSISGSPLDAGTEILRPTFHNEPGGSITKTSSASDFTISMLLDNDGTLARPAGSAGDLNVSDSGGASGGTFDGVVLSPNAARPLQLGTGAVLRGVNVTGHVVIPAGETLEVENLAISSGTLDGDGTIVLEGHTTAYFGNLGSADTVVVQPADATMTWTHAFGILARRFASAGLVTVEETGLGRPETRWGHGLVWENTGVVRLHSGLFPTFAGDERARFVNRGLLVKETTGNFAFRPRLVNDGVIDLVAGRLTATRLEQTPDGTLKVELRGATAGSGFGALTATALRHQGRLEARLAGGFVPATGTRLQIITGTDRSGAFGTTALAGLQLDESQPTNIALVAPAPGAADAAQALGEATFMTSPRRAILRAADDAALLRQGRVLVLRPLANDRAPAGTRLRVVARSRGLRVQRRGTTLRIRPARGARGPLRVRYQLVAADGRRSRVATVRLRLAR